MGSKKITPMVPAENALGVLSKKQNKRTGRQN